MFSRNIRDNLHPAFVQRTAADDAEIVAPETVILPVVLQNPPQVVSDAFVHGSHDVLPGVNHGHVEQSGPSGGGGDGTSLSQHPRGADQVVAARRDVGHHGVHVVIDSVTQFFHLLSEKLVLQPLDVGAGGFRDSRNQVHLLVGALDGGGTVLEFVRCSAAGCHPGRGA